MYNKKEPKLSDEGFLFFYQPSTGKISAGIYFLLMKVILIKDVPKLGRTGEIKEVNAGFATNFLIKKGLAKLATIDAQKSLESSKKELSAKKERMLTKLSQAKEELERRTFTVKVKTGDKGQIFGGVHEKDIAQAIFQKTKLSFDRSQISAHKGIKQLGEHQIEVKLGQGIVAKIKINIEAL